MKNEMIERFWSYVEKLSENECWVWKGTKQANRSGMYYGYFRVFDKMKRANRLAYSLFNNIDIPENLVVRHTCDNSLCCNPKHLILGTQKDNVADRNERGRSVNLKGSDHGNSKLTENDIPEIRKMLADGISQRKIAVKFNVSQNQIKEINLKRSWTHV